MAIGSPEMEGESVRTFRQFDDNGIGRSFRAVVLRQFDSQATGLNANGGIGGRIEIRRAAEDLSRQLIFLDRSSGMVERLLSQILKHLAQRFRSVKDGAVCELFDFLRELIALRHVKS